MREKKRGNMSSVTPNQKKLLTSLVSAGVCAPEAGADDDAAFVPATTPTEPVRTTVSLSLAPARSKSISTDARLLLAGVVFVVSIAIPAAAGARLIPGSQSGPSRDNSVREAVIESVRVWISRPTVKNGIDNPSVVKTVESLYFQDLGVLTDDDGAEDDKGYDGLQGGSEDFPLGPGYAVAGFG